MHRCKGLSDRAMLELLYATGIRVSGLIALNISDVNTLPALWVCAQHGKRRLIRAVFYCGQRPYEYINL